MTYNTHGAREDDDAKNMIPAASSARDEPEAAEGVDASRNVKADTEARFVQ